MRAQAGAIEVGSPYTIGKTILLYVLSKKASPEGVTTKLSSKGQVVLPRLVRNQLGLEPGTRLLCEVRGGSIVLTPKGVPARQKEYVVDEISGLRVTKKPAGVELVGSEWVKKLAAEFP